MKNNEFKHATCVTGFQRKNKQCNALLVAMSLFVEFEQDVEYMGDVDILIEILILAALITSYNHCIASNVATLGH